MLLDNEGIISLCFILLQCMPVSSWMLMRQAYNGNLTITVIEQTSLKVPYSANFTLPMISDYNKCL